MWAPPSPVFGNVRALYPATTASDGTYFIQLTGPTGPAGVSVCFVGVSMSTERGPSSCHRNMPWTEGQPPPSGTTAVVVAAAHVASGIDGVIQPPIVCMPQPCMGSQPVTLKALR